MKLTKKHTGTAVTIFTEMSALAQKNNAINLSQGFPDYEIDDRLKQLLAKATQQNFNQYAPLSGNPLLIQNLIEFNRKRENPIYFNGPEICIIPGATYGIYTALATIIEPNDEVVLIEPAYDSYRPAVEMQGGIPISISLNENFEMNWEDLKAKINPRTRAIIINTPHNPSGKIWSFDDWEQLWNIIKDTEILVISDEVYDLITFDDYQFTSAQHHPELKKRAFSVFSFGKMIHITGWKVGYILAPESLMAAFRSIHQYLVFCVNAPAQQALAEYLEVFDVQENRNFMQQKRDFFLSEMKETPFTLKNRAEGGYFQVLGYEKFSDKNDKDFAVLLTEQHQVATIPMSAFYSNQTNTQSVRFCFTKKEETIMNAVKNLKKLL